jgi:hypothetical protein
MLRRVRIIEELGAQPSNPSDLVAIIAKRDQMEVLFDGTLTRDVVPYVIDEKTGEKNFASKKEAQSDWMASYVHFHFPKTIDLMQFELELRVLSTNLKLGYTASEIADAVQVWHAHAKKSRLFMLSSEIGEGKAPPVVTEPAGEMWKAIATKVFDTSHDAPEFIIAMLQKFMWQVKRKVLGLPITDHLMPVIIGPQGCGKRRSWTSSSGRSRNCRFRSAST